MRVHRTSVIIVLLVIFGGLAAVLVTHTTPQLGLDLQGGYAVVLEPTGDQPVDNDTLDVAVDIIRNRVDALGVAEPSVSRQGDGIVVELPGVADREQACRVVGTTAELQFRPVLQGISQYGGAFPGTPEESLELIATYLGVAGGATTDTTVAGDTTTTVAGDTTTTAAGTATTAAGATTTIDAATDDTAASDDSGAATTAGKAAQEPTTTTADATTTTADGTDTTAVGDTTTTTAATTTTTAPVTTTTAAVPDACGGDDDATTTTTVPVAGGSSTTTGGGDSSTTTSSAGATTTTATTDDAGATTTTATTDDAGAATTAGKAAQEPTSTTTAASTTSTAGATTTTAAGATTTTAAGATTTTVPFDPVAARAALGLGDPDDPTSNALVPGEIDGQPVTYFLGPVGATGEIVDTAERELQGGVEWVVRVDFTDSGGQIFDQLAAQYSATSPSRQMAIVLDDEVVSAPTLQVTSFNGTAIISGGPFSKGEAGDLALVLKYGALPIELEIATQQQVSATLGRDQLDAGIAAGIVGFVLVAIYMLFWYRILGLVIIATLGLTGATLYALVAFLGEVQGVTLTLAGVTGLIVSTGLAVDSNIVYFERLKDEVKQGASVRSSAARGFRKAFRTIIAADFVSLIAAVLLWLIAVGSVRGFAYFLGLATLIDLVLTYAFMHPLTMILVRNRKIVEAPRWGVAAALHADQLRPAEVPT